MTRRTPFVVSPVVPLAVIDGFEVLLVSVEAWPDRVRTRLAVSVDEFADALDAEVEASIRHWEQNRQEGPHPEHPVLKVFHQIEVSLRDSDATLYECLSASAQGIAAVEWEANWFFGPGVPDGVNGLEVVARTPEGNSRVVVSMSGRG